MFESDADEHPGQGGEGCVPEAVPHPVVRESVVEENGVWGLHDWSRVPVDTSTDEPPPGWLEQCRGWLDELIAPEMGAVSWFEALPPSSRLMAELEALPVEVVESEYDEVELVAHWDRLEAHCAARKRATAARLARRELMAGGLANLDHLGVRVAQPNIAADELSLRLGVGKRAALRLMNAGRAMNGIAIPTAEALEAGEIDAVKADIIALGVEGLTPEEALEVQDLVLAKAPFMPSGSVRRELAVARARVLPAQFEERCAQAARLRRVDRPRVLPDGMASLYAIMPAVAANQVYRAVDAAARSTKSTGDPRTLDQLRADALGLMGAAAIDAGWIGTSTHTCDEPTRADVPTTECSGPGRAGTGAPTHAASGVVPRHERAPGEGSAHPRRGPSSQPDERRGRTGERQRSRDPRGPDEAAPPNEPDSSPAPRDSAESADPAAPTGWLDPADAAAWSAAGAGVCPPLAGERMRVGMIGGKSAHVRVVVPLTSLMGGRGGPGHGLEGSDTPADLEGYGPIPASVGRALAAGGPWSRMVTDPVDRTVLEVSPDRYAPPAAMAALVRAAQPECAQPTCTVSSDSCDLHHRIPWPAGPTSATNLDPGCRRDHLLVTHAGWSYIQHPDGGRTWTTATHHVYTQHTDGRITMNPPQRGSGARTNPHEGGGPTTTQPVRRPPTADDPPPF